MGTDSDWRHPECLVLLPVSAPRGSGGAGSACKGCSGRGQPHASIYFEHRLRDPEAGLGQGPVGKEGLWGLGQAGFGASPFGE